MLTYKYEALMRKTEIYNTIVIKLKLVYSNGKKRDQLI